MQKRIEELEANATTLLYVYLLSYYTSAESILKDGRQLDFNRIIRTSKGDVKTKNLTDTEVSALSFINSSFVK